MKNSSQESALPLATKAMTIIAWLFVLVAVLSLGRTLITSMRSPDLSKSTPATKPLSVAGSSEKTGFHPASIAEPPYDEQRAAAWLQQHEEAPVAFSVQQTRDGVQLVQPDGNLKPEMVQVARAGSSGVEYVPAPASSPAVPTVSETAKVSKPVLSSKGFSATKPENDSDHYSIRHLTPEAR